MNVTEHKIRLDGLDINYVSGGSGQPMIFLHNGGGFWHSWEYQIRYFTEAYHVYALDWPGFGESDKPEGNITLDLLTKTLQSFIDEKALTHLILIGNCIGGSVALNYSLHHPDKVSKLLIFNICPGNLVVRSPIMRRYLMYLNGRPKSKKIFGSILQFGATKTPIKYQFPKILFGKNPPRESSLFRRYVEKFKSEKQSQARIQLLFAADTFNLDRYYNPENTPDHLLIWGTENQVTSWEKHGVLHKNLLQSKEFELVPNAGHLCMYEAPETVNSIIERYLSLEKK